MEKLRKRILDQQREDEESRGEIPRGEEGCERGGGQKKKKEETKRRRNNIFISVFPFFVYASSSEKMNFSHKIRS